MAINILPPGGANQGSGVHVDQTQSRGSKKASTETGAHQAGGDKVTLTSQAESLGKLADLLKDTPDIDDARVGAIRAQIADGSFKIDSAAIADKLIQADKDLS